MAGEFFPFFIIIILTDKIIMIIIWEQLSYSCFFFVFEDFNRHSVYLSVFSNDNPFMLIPCVQSIKSLSLNG